MPISGIEFLYNKIESSVKTSQKFLPGLKSQKEIKKELKMYEKIQGYF